MNTYESNEHIFYFVSSVVLVVVITTKLVEVDKKMRREIKELLNIYIHLENLRKRIVEKTNTNLVSGQRC